MRARQARTNGDLETETRLLNVAARLFAARGFKHVTVREICAEANANVAAVNYHFGDKLGLYREVLAKAICTMRATSEAARRAGEGGSPEHKLREYVRVFVERVSKDAHDSWIHQLMAHEIADPTPALDVVVEEVIRPRLGYVAEVVAEILGRDPHDETVMRCVLSIQAQCHATMPNPVTRRIHPELPTGRSALDQLAAHVAEFSLAGIRAVAQQPAVAVRPKAH
jgi:AcrR family transcriptional regulator